MDTDRPANGRLASLGQPIWRVESAPVRLARSLARLPCFRH